MSKINPSLLSVRTRTENYYSMGIEFQFVKILKFLEINGGNGCITLNCVLKNGCSIFYVYFSTIMNKNRKI